MAGEFTLRGIITALVTPFFHQGEVDQEALREIVHFQMKHGVSGLFPCGTAGLGPAMRPDQRKKVVEVVVQEVGKRIPVIVHVGASDPNVSYELAAHAEKVGADAVASVPPFFYQPGDEAIVEYFNKLSDATELPIFVYNIPRATGTNVDANLLLKLSKIPHIVGIKDSSRDMTLLMDYLQVVPDGFNIVNGNDSYLLAALCVGAQSGISATASAFPEVLVEMYEAFRACELERAAALQLRIHALWKIVSKPPVAPLLAALRLRGLKSGLVRPPLRSLTASELEELRMSVSQIVPELELTKYA